MKGETNETRRPSVKVERLCVWGVLIAASLGPLRWAGADVASCAVFIAWGTLVGATRARYGERAGAVVSGSIAAACAIWAAYEDAARIRPPPPMDGLAIVMLIAFAIGYGASLVIGAFFDQAAKGLRRMLHRADERGDNPPE